MEEIPDEKDFNHPCQIEQEYLIQKEAIKMKKFIQWHNDTFGEKVVKALEKNNFKAYYVSDRAAATEKVFSLIPDGATVGVGGSWTLKELGIPEQLEKDGHTVYDHNKAGLTMEESMALRRKELLCDVFISGTNAVTLDGQLVNTDGSGNRVAAMSFGPQKVVVVIGVNKIVPDLDAAMERIELYAAPINNKRLDRPNPCTITGMCMDCQGATRICNMTSILHKKPPAIDFHVVVVGEALGF